MLHTITEDEHIGMETFMHDCMRLKAEATSLDSQGMLFKMQIMCTTCRSWRRMYQVLISSAGIAVGLVTLLV